MNRRQHLLPLWRLCALFCLACLARALPAQAAPTLTENAAQVKSAGAAHIAVLLPLDHPVFRQAAKAVQLGITAAAKQQTNAPPLRLYPTNDEPGNVAAAYQQALANGATTVIGPLTKPAIASLAASDQVKVPTLALSIPDQAVNQGKLYLFGLSLEAEIRQLAEMMRHDGHRSVLVVGMDDALGKRLHAAFADAWTRLGGAIAGHLDVAPTADLGTLPEMLAKFKSPDALFLAMNAREASLLRPYFLTTLAQYGSSQIHGRGGLATDNDLAGVRFLDMPWLLQPDHSAVMIYSRPEDAGWSADQERLYALGIDAFRLAVLLYENKLPASGDVLDGVTGQIRLGADRQFLRALTAAEFQTNAIVVLDHGQP